MLVKFGGDCSLLQFNIEKGVFNLKGLCMGVFNSKTLWRWFILRTLWMWGGGDKFLKKLLHTWKLYKNQGLNISCPLPDLVVFASEFVITKTLFVTLSFYFDIMIDCALNSVLRFASSFRIKFTQKFVSIFKIVFCSLYAITSDVLVQFSD